MGVILWQFGIVKITLFPSPIIRNSLLVNEHEEYFVFPRRLPLSVDRVTPIRDSRVAAPTDAPMILIVVPRQAFKDRTWILQRGRNQLSGFSRLANAPLRDGYQPGVRDQNIDCAGRNIRGCDG